LRNGAALKCISSAVLRTIDFTFLALTAFFLQKGDSVNKKQGRSIDLASSEGTISTRIEQKKSKKAWLLVPMWSLRPFDAKAKRSYTARNQG
jgi:hypothetical protein